MTLFLQKFSKFHKHINHHHHDSTQNQALSASLHNFHSQISKLISQLTFSSPNPSLSYITKCFSLLPLAHKAFANLVVDIDYPISKWNPEHVEAYLDYCSTLLQLFNSISSSLSSISQSRLSLSFGLVKFKKSPSSAGDFLKGIEIGSCKKDDKFKLKMNPNLEAGFEKSKDFSQKERVLTEAVDELRSVGLRVCGIVLTGLASDACGFADGGSVQLGEKLMVLKEVKEINDAVGDLVGDDGVKDGDLVVELQKKVDLFQKGLDDLSKEVDEMFNKIMAQRNELIDCFRFRDRSPRKKSSVV